MGLRNAKLDEEILYPMGLDLRAFYQSNLSIRPEVVIPLVQRMEKYDLRLWVLVTGVDDSAHVYKIGNPGRLINFSRKTSITPTDYPRPTWLPVTTPCGRSVYRRSAPG